MRVCLLTLDQTWHLLVGLVVAVTVNLVPLSEIFYSVPLGSLGKAQGMRASL